MFRNIQRRQLVLAQRWASSLRVRLSQPAGFDSTPAQVRWPRFCARRPPSLQDKVTLNPQPPPPRTGTLGAGR